MPGLLQPEDIPTAAVDFHICNIVEELLQRPPVAAAAAEAAAAMGRDAAGCLKKAMWLHRSSLNWRRPLQVLPFLEGNDSWQPCIHLLQTCYCTCRDACMLLLGRTGSKAANERSSS